MDKNVKRITVLVNGSPQVMQLTTNRDKHFIKKPSVAQLASPLLQFAGVVWTKSIAPSSNRFIGNLDSTLCQKVFDISETEAEPMVQPNGVTDDLRRKSMTVIQWFGIFH